MYGGQCRRPPQPELPGWASQLLLNKGFRIEEFQQRLQAQVRRCNAP